MDQNYNNGQHEFLWTLLANPANDANLYAYNLHRLVNDFPQSGILQALLAHASDEKDLKKASAYFSPKTLYKLVHSPGTFIGVLEDKITIQTSLQTNGSSFTPAPAELTNGYHLEEYRPEAQHTEEIHDVLPKPEETNHEQAHSEHPAVSEFIDEPHTAEHANFNEFSHEPLTDFVEPFTEHDAIESVQEIANGAKPDRGAVHEDHQEIAHFEHVEDHTITDEPHHTTDNIHHAVEQHPEAVTYSQDIPAGSDTIDHQIQAGQESEVTAEFKEAEAAHHHAADTLTEAAANNNTEAAAAEKEPEVGAVSPESPAAGTEKFNYKEETYRPSFKPDWINAQEEQITNGIEENHNIAEEEEKLITGGIASGDYFMFDQAFGKGNTEEVKPADEPIPNQISEPSEAVHNVALNDDVSKYHDEKMPYTFMWWLDKTRKEHEGIYQPYVKPEQTVETVEEKVKKPEDELQQQYYENIFHITSFEELDKTTAPRVSPPKPDFKRKEQLIIERFIQEEPQIRPQSSDKLDNENKAKKSSEDRDELVTETLAGIYTDQMLYHKAIASYKKLMLKFPEKSRYFAEKIEQLEKKTN